MEGLAIHDHCFDCFDREDEHFTFLFFTRCEHDTHVYIQPHMYVLVNTFVDIHHPKYGHGAFQVCQYVPDHSLDDVFFAFAGYPLFFFGASGS